MLSHCNLLHNLYMVYHAYEHTSESSVVSWLPPYHEMGLIGGVLQSLYGSMTTYLMSPGNFLQQPFYWLKAISHFKATTSGAPNFAYDLCVRKITQEQSETLNLSNWDLAFTGAEPICHQTLHRFQKKFSSQGFRAQAFYPCYGLAEATLFVVGGMKKELPIVAAVDSKAFEQNRVERNPRLCNKMHKVVSSGRAIMNQRILIVDSETFNTCADNKIGEIWISSPSIAMGYWNREEETQATFNAYTACAGQGPFLRTGDLGFINDGELFITGRLKDIIIIRYLKLKAEEMRPHSFHVYN